MSSCLAMATCPTIQLHDGYLCWGRCEVISPHFFLCRFSWASFLLVLTISCNRFEALFSLTRILSDVDESLMGNNHSVVSCSFTVYAPNSITERATFWERICLQIAGEEEWCIGGDFNMIKSLHDSSSNNPIVLQGREHKQWEKLCVHLNLQDICVEYKCIMAVFTLSLCITQVRAISVISVKGSCLKSVTI